MLLAQVCIGQRQPQTRPAPIDPVQAEREARALVAEILSQKPAQTNTGLLKIRDAKGEQRCYALPRTRTSITTSSAVFAAAIRQSIW